MLIGGVTPVALPDGVPIWVDAAVMKPASIVLGGGDRSTKLRMTPQTLVSLPNVEVVDDLAKPNHLHPACRRTGARRAPRVHTRLRSPGAP